MEEPHNHLSGRDGQSALGTFGARECLRRSGSTVLHCSQGPPGQPDLRRRNLELGTRVLAPLPYLREMLRPAYLSQKLRRPLPTKDRGTLQTVADAADYMVALPEERRRAHWKRAAQLLLDGADAPDLSRQVELALFYDRKLDFKAESIPEI
jgi:hypothetical protein